MAWRQSYRDSTLSELSAAARVDRVSEWIGTASCRGGTERLRLRAAGGYMTEWLCAGSCHGATLTHQDLLVSAGPVECGFSVLSTADPSARVETTLLPRFGEVDVRLTARLAVTPLLEPGAIVACIVDLAIALPTPVRHSFLTRPEPRNRLFTGPRDKKGPPSDEPPAPAAPPPGLDKLSLQERLRWLLTPPIQELLRDPLLALPHEPYKYQKFGIKWLMDREYALLADEMGLGKTMQAIIAARLLWREQRIKRLLVVCPKTLIPIWREEIERWWPSAMDNTKVIEDRPEWYLRLATDNVTIQIINYERLARLADWLEGQAFSHDLVIIDEAQRIKNPGTSTARAVKALGADRRWALTGTPLENRVGDAVSIFGFVHPGLLESEETEYVRSRIRPHMLRRRTDEVGLDLPKLVEDPSGVPIELTEMQRRAYERAETEGVVALNEQGDTITVQQVFALIQKLMQLCNFDAGSGESAKLARLAEDLEDIVDSGRKALIFSRFVSQPFGLKQLALMLPKHCESEMPVVCVPMHGEVRPGERESNVERFREDPAINVMLLNYQVGGVGLNLQSANYVYLFDRWWNPAVEDQAVKRAHRIGQKSTVFVFRFFCRDTIEERILQKPAEKRRLFAHVIDSDRPTPAMMGLSEEEVFQLFKDLKVRPRRRGQTTGPVRMRMDALTPADFEEVTAQVYERQGFRVDRRGGPHDQGIDLIAERSDAGHTDRLRVAVQCKHHEADIGPAPVRELLGVLARDPAFHRADLITSADFTAAARSAAFGHRIELINGVRFKELSRKHEVAVFED